MVTHGLTALAEFQKTSGGFAHYWSCCNTHAHSGHTQRNNSAATFAAAKTRDDPGVGREQ